MTINLTEYQTKYYAYELTKRCPVDSLEKLAGALVDAQVDLNAHQVEAALFAFKSPFSIMPNHVHGIIVLCSGDVGAGFKPAPTETKQYGLPEIVRALKTYSSRRINEIRNTPGTPVWQRNYYEHIIRNDGELNRIREYIVNNPEQWEEDENNPKHVVEYHA